MCILPLVSEQFLNLPPEVMCCIFREDFMYYTSFTLSSPEQTFLGMPVHRQKWILAKSNRDREGDTGVFHKKYTDSYVLSYPLFLGSYTLSLESFSHI